VKITVRQRPRIATLAPPYADKLQAIKAGVDAGEPVARYQAGLALYECRDVPVDDKGLQAEVEEIHQTRKHQGWEVSDPATEERALRAGYKACLGVSTEERDKFRDYLKSAADAGLLEAQLDLMYHLPKGEYCQYIEDCPPKAVAAMSALREEAKTYVQKALDGGSVEAMRTMAGWNLNEEMGTPNEIEAYAYFDAYDQVQKAFGQEREVVAMLKGLKKRLRPVDLDQAAAKTKELLSNPNCCLLTK
jgi:TPR repeat protein